MSETHELRIEGHIAAPVDLVWRAWVDHQEEWFCPKPWRAEVRTRELRPGGRSAIVMHGPAGEEMPFDGVFLEVVPGKRIVSTDAFTAAGTRPVPSWSASTSLPRRARAPATPPSRAIGPRTRATSTPPWGSSPGGMRRPTSWKRSSAGFGDDVPDGD